MCPLFGMGVGADERRIYKRMSAARAQKRVVWQGLGDMIRLGWVIGEGKKVVMTAISRQVEKRLVVGWFTLAELMK